VSNNTISTILGQGATGLNIGAAGTASTLTVEGMLSIH
jgi:hypothetical protein